MPITRMIVPVTTGGKNRSIRLAIGAISTPMTPAAMIEPKIIRAPSAPGWASAIDTIGPTEAKVTPIITGMRTPNQGVTPSDCRIDTTPQQKRSAEIRKATSSGGSCSARPMIRGTAMAPAYMTSTCCRPSVNSFGAGSISSTGWMAVAIVQCLQSGMQLIRGALRADCALQQRAIRRANCRVRKATYTFGAPQVLPGKMGPTCEELSGGTGGRWQDRTIPLSAYSESSTTSSSRPGATFERTRRIRGRSRFRAGAQLGRSVPEAGNGVRSREAAGARGAG